MSKAKEILEKLKDKVFMTEKGLVSFAPIIGEAIAELEALQQLKSCDGCKYEYKDASSLPCAACVRNCDSDYYEPKGTVR